MYVYRISEVQYTLYNQYGVNLIRSKVPDERLAADRLNSIMHDDAINVATNFESCLLLCRGFF